MTQSYPCKYLCGPWRQSLAQNIKIPVFELNFFHFFFKPLFQKESSGKIFSFIKIWVYLHQNRVQVNFQDWFNFRMFAVTYFSAGTGNNWDWFRMLILTRRKATIKWARIRKRANLDMISNYMVTRFRRLKQKKQLLLIWASTWMLFLCIKLEF